jgi:hypothetical protein
MQTITPSDAARRIREKMPTSGLFAGQEWRISPTPFALGAELASELETFGRVLLQFNRAVNLLYRQSVAGKQPTWVAEWLDRGKPPELIETQRHAAFKNDVPRVIRPDVILTEGPNGTSQSSFCITELDSVPGGIGLTAWLNQTYSDIPAARTVTGNSTGMLDGFASIFGDAKNVHIVISEEAKTYRPEMEWVSRQLGDKFHVHDSTFDQFSEGDAVYRFFELFDLPNVGNAKKIFELAAEKKIRVTPPPKPMFEEKMLFALLWNRHLRNFWRQELGERFFERLQQHVPYTWVVDPAPLPPQAAIPELNLADWRELESMSQKERNLILKVSGFSEKAWGARGVYLGSDLSTTEWSAAVEEALRSFPTSPYVLQKFQKPRLAEAHYFDFDKNEVVTMPGRVRLCPYYFVKGDNDAARATLGGVLATICPADKKIIHGMSTAILAPCSI